MDIFKFELILSSLPTTLQPHKLGQTSSNHEFFQTSSNHFPISSFSIQFKLFAWKKARHKIRSFGKQTGSNRSPSIFLEKRKTFYRKFRWRGERGLETLTFRDRSERFCLNNSSANVYSRTVVAWYDYVDVTSITCSKEYITRYIRLPLFSYSPLCWILLRVSLVVSQFEEDCNFC